MAVECNGTLFPSAVAASGFVDGHVEVTVSGLTPGTRYSLRCRCELEDPDVDPEYLWSPRVDVMTLDEVCGHPDSLAGATCVPLLPKR